MAAILVPTTFSSGEMREIEEAIRRKFGSGAVIPDAAATRVISHHARSEEELEKAIQIFNEAKRTQSPSKAD
jgi:hypothetical protein